MNCRDYERTWDGWLDAREALAPAPAADMEAHEASCASCRALGRRQRTLLRAIAALGPPPSPPAGFATRFAPGGVVSVPFPGPIARPWRPRRLAAAAAAVLIGLIGLRAAQRPSAPEIEPLPVAAPRPLADSLADATSATLDLAREASGPAARVGRGAWVAGLASEVEGTPEAATSNRPAPGVLKGVGDRVGEGVRPLSGSARHAFGFLLDPVLAGEDARDGA